MTLLMKKINQENNYVLIFSFRKQLEPLLQQFPRSTFWIDEAYVQYIEPGQWDDIATLIPKYPNLIISRSFSFAYGLAGLHTGRNSDSRNNRVQVICWEANNS